MADPAAGQGRLQRGGQVEGVGEQVVAHQDGRLVAPLGVDRRGVAADHRLVEDVVVDERRGVDHLDDRRQDRVVGPDRRRRPWPSGGPGRAGAACPGSRRSARPDAGRTGTGCPARRRRPARPRPARRRSGRRGPRASGRSPRISAASLSTSPSLPQTRTDRPQAAHASLSLADNRRSARPTSPPAGPGRSPSPGPPPCTCRRSSGPRPRPPSGPPSRPPSCPGPSTVASILTVDSSIGLEVHRHPVDPQRVAERDQVARSASPP